MVQLGTHLKEDAVHGNPSPTVLEWHRGGIFGKLFLTPPPPQQNCAQAGINPFHIISKSSETEVPESNFEKVVDLTIRAAVMHWQGCWLGTSAQACQILHVVRP